MSEHAEIWYSGDVQRTTFADEHQPADIYEALRLVFPWVQKEHYFSISEPSHHDIIGEPVITCCFPLPEAIALLGPNTALGARKFCMDSATSFLRTYELFDRPRPDWAPESADILFVGKNLQEFRRPFPDVVTRFEDIYFSADPDEAEELFGLPYRRGAFSTWYGVTLLDGVVSRVKQYCYEEDGKFADWRRAYDVYIERINA